MVGTRAATRTTFVLFGAFVCLGLVAAPARVVHAGEVVAGVSVEPPRCPFVPVAMPAFVEALRVELATRAPLAGPLVVSLAIEPCDAAATRVEATARAERSRRSASRELALGDLAPAARPRALALAVAELVRDADALPALPPPVAPPHALEGAKGPYHAVTTVEAFARFVPERETTMWGARLSLGDESADVHGALFLQAASGGRQLAAGDVTVRSLGAGTAFGPVNRLGPLLFKTAVVLAFDYVRIAGVSPASGVVTGAGGGVAVSFGLHLALALPIGRAWSLHAFAEPGLVLRHVDAIVDDTPVAGLRGPMLAFGVGGAYGRP